MAYENVLKESMSTRGIIMRWLKLIPYTAIVSLKQGSLFVLFNAFAVFVSFSLYQNESYSWFVSIAMGLSVFCFGVNFILGYSSVKLMQDGVNGSNQDVLGAVILTIRKSIIIFASSFLLGAAIYFTLLPAMYLSGGFKNWYLFILVLIYTFFSPYIIFYPWMIMLEDKSVFESFSASYHLVRSRWIKYALLFFLSALIMFFAVIGIIFFAGLISVWINWEASWSLWRMNQFLGDTMPFNIKLAILFSQMTNFGLKATFSLTAFMLFSLYVAVFGLNMFVMILAVSYKTLNDYNLIASSEKEEKPEPKEDDLFEITSLFKNVKEITIDTKEPETFDDSAIGHLNRSETLRQFNKEDEDTANFGKVKHLVHEYPDPTDSEDEKQ